MDAHAVEQAVAATVKAVPRCVRKEASVERECAPRFARCFSTTPMLNWRAHFASAIDGIRGSFIPTRIFILVKRALITQEPCHVSPPKWGVDFFQAD